MSTSANGSAQADQRTFLAKVADVALGVYGFPEATKTFVSDSENTIFRVETLTSQYALRIHPPGNHATDTIMAELHWLTALHSDLALLVPKPIPAPDGRYVLEVTTSIMPEPRQVVLFEWLPGDLLDDHLTPQIVAKAGIFMAQLHQHAEQFTLPENSFRPHANFKELQIWQSPSLLKHYQIKTAQLSEADYTLCVETATAVTDWVHEFNGPHDYGLIHGDLHQWNLIVHEGQLGALDFDDCLVASYCLDLAIPLSYLDHRADYGVLKESFLTGYTAVRPLPQNVEKGITTFMLVRALDMILWILRWPAIDHQPFGPELLQNSLARLNRHSHHQL